jgi:beta-amylase
MPRDPRNWAGIIPENGFTGMFPVHLRFHHRPTSTSTRTPSDLGQYSINVMGPLLVGDAKHPNSPENAAAWDQLEKTLKEAKSLGAEAVSADVWWGLIEPRDGKFNFAYYDRFADAVEKAGLKWVPILSFHQCGGNVGDDCDVKLPTWLARKYGKLDPTAGPNALFAKSEQGNFNHESISPWASQAALGEYESVMRAFQKHFAQRRDLIAEINISLGPAGELRYPSYNSHDKGTDYPTRGALQAYSNLAIRDFQRFVLSRHGTLENAALAWGARLESVSDIRPPSDAKAFFQQGDQHTPYGRDLFDWYSDSLQDHGTRILKKAIEVFDAPNAPFKGIDLGAKIPGIHWRMASDRAAELAAGLLQTSRVDEWNSSSAGHGYEEMVDVFKNVAQLKNAPKVVLHFTALEMDDGEGGPDVGSQAKSLVFWVAEEAKQEGVPVKGENALNYTLANEHAWQNIKDALRNGGYEGVTFLRVNDIVANDFAREQFKDVASEFD